MNRRTPYQKLVIQQLQGFIPISKNTRYSLDGTITVQTFCLQKDGLGMHVMDAITEWALESGCEVKVKEWRDEEHAPQFRYSKRDKRRYYFPTYTNLNGRPFLEISIPPGEPE
jgi:hypothetical protein